MSDASHLPTRERPGRYVVAALVALALVLFWLVGLAAILDADTSDRVTVDLSQVPCDGLLRLMENPGDGTPWISEQVGDEYADRCVTNGSAGVASNAGPGFYGNGNCDRYCMMAVLGRQSGVML